MNVGYDVSYLILVVEYLILFALGLLALLRLRFKSNLKHGWQANFFALLLTGCLARAVSFFLQPFIMENELLLPNKWNSAILDVTSLLFLTAYQIILYHWTEIYHIQQRNIAGSVATSLPDGNQCEITPNILQAVFVSIGIFVWSLTLILITMDLSSADDIVLPYAQSYTSLEVVVGIMLSSFYTIASIAFLTYGLLVYQRFSALMPTVTPARKAIAIRLRVIMIVVPLCFMMRVPLILVNSKFEDLTTKWWFGLTYYSVLELLPLLLLLKVLHMDPQRRQNLASVMIPSTNTYYYSSMPPK